MFDCSRELVRRSLPIAFLLVFLSAFTSLLYSQTLEDNPNAGTIVGTVQDDVGAPIEGARVFYNSTLTDTRGVTRTDKDGKYVTEILPPGIYDVLIEARNFLRVNRSVTVVAGGAVAADFKLEWIDPGPVRPDSKFSGDAPDTLPINGHNFLAAGGIEPGVQAVDGAVLDPGKSGSQTLSINSLSGRTTHYDMDEVEVMDETKGALALSLPADAVREVTVSRGMPEVFQSLNAAGSVRIATRIGGDEWHGHIFGNMRDQFLGLAGFPSHSPNDYSRQQYGFAAGGSLIPDKAFLFVSGERTKQDGTLPANVAFPNTTPTDLLSAYFRENMLTARLDYNFNDDMKGFIRLTYDNANEIGPSQSLSNFRNQINVPAAVVGLDWNRGKFVNSARFGIQKMVNAINPALNDSLILPGAPFHIQLGTYGLGPSVLGPRQTIQRDLYGRYDSSTQYNVFHRIRFGGSIHRIDQGDYYAPVNYASVTSSNGIDVIDAINTSSLNLFPGGADNPLNYPVGTVTIFNGLGNFSGDSAFGRSTGGHADTRIEGYIGDTFNIVPSLNISFGVNYVRDTGRTNSDLGTANCSAINTSIVPNPPCTTGLILDQFGLEPRVSLNQHLNLGETVNQPNFNFAPQVGLAWDPGHSGRTVMRLSGGLFYDNFLLQNAYQDRINRLSNGQYNRSLTLCPTGAILYPNGSIVNSVNGVDIATGICGQPIGSVATEIQDLQSQFVAAQSAVTGGANMYSLTNSLANFGGLLAPSYKTPRVVHISVGMEHQLADHAVFAIDYTRDIGTQFPLGIDSNHVGDASYLTDGDNITNPLLNTYASELSAINATVQTVSGCPIATSTGGSSQAAINCYLAAKPTASIVDFARNGLDSSNAFCGPFPCQVLGKQQASFGGVNPNVGSNVMFFPSGRSLYQALQMSFRASSADNPARNVRKFDIAINYAWSRYRTNVAEPNGSGGDYSILTVAQNNNSPHRGYWGISGMDRTHQFTFAPTAELSHHVHVSMIAHVASPLPLSLSVPQQDGGGVAGEIYRSDLTGDGTVGDLLGHIGSTGHYNTTQLTNLINLYNSSLAGKLTPAGSTLAISGLFSPQQLLALGAYAPLIQNLPAHSAEATWLKTIDLRLAWPVQVSERVKLEPTFSVLNAFNFANFGGAGNQLSGILNGSPGSAFNNASGGGYCGNSTAFCTSRLDRILPGSGTYSVGAPRQMEFGVRVTF